MSCPMDIGVAAANETEHVVAAAEPRRVTRDERDPAR